MKFSGESFKNNRDWICYTSIRPNTNIMTPISFEKYETYSKVRSCNLFEIKYYLNCNRKPAVLQNPKYSVYCILYTYLYYLFCISSYTHFQPGIFCTSCRSPAACLFQLLTTLYGVSCTQSYFFLFIIIITFFLFKRILVQLNHPSPHYLVCSSPIKNYNWLSKNWTKAIKYSFTSREQWNRSVRHL